MFSNAIPIWGTNDRIILQNFWKWNTHHPRAMWSKLLSGSLTSLASVKMFKVTVSPKLSFTVGKNSTRQKLNWTAECSEHLGDTTWAVWRHVMFFICWLFLTYQYNGGPQWPCTDMSKKKQQMKNMTCLHTAQVVSSKCSEHLAVQFIFKHQCWHHVFSQNILCSPPLRSCVHVLPY